MIEVTCNNCGWVHFTYTRRDAQNSVESFNEYFDSLTTEKQQEYYGGRRSSIEGYEGCFRCGGSYKDFRLSKDGDCPHGCTIQPIIHFEEPESMTCDFSTCTPEEALSFFARDGLDFDTSVNALFACFIQAGRLADLEPYLEPDTE